MANRTTDRERSHRDAHAREDGADKPLAFDPHLTCSLRTVQAIGDNIASHWLHVRDRKDRRRAMRKVDEANRRAVLHAILANLALAAGCHRQAPTVSLSLATACRRGTRYDRPGFRTLPTVAGMLEQGGMLSLHVSRRKGEPSTITAAPFFADLVARLPVTAADFGRVPGGETIVLSRVVERDRVAGTKRVEWVDYKADPVADRFRAELAAINAFLASADLAFADDGGELPAVTSRHLKRYFTLPEEIGPLQPSQRFDLGGRLFGGWWQGLPKRRRPAIRIAGEPIADLDFAAMFLRLAYIESGTTPPAGDLYAFVQGLSEPQWRPGVKVVAATMLFATTAVDRLPRGSGAMLPPGASGAKVRAAILAAHPALEGVFETGIGHHLMFLESQILVAVLSALAGRGIVALPMHDGVMVAASKAAEAEAVMAETAEQLTGCRLPVIRKV